MRVSRPRTWDINCVLFVRRLTNIVQHFGVFRYAGEATHMHTCVSSPRASQW